MHAVEQPVQQRRDNQAGSYQEYYATVNGVASGKNFGRILSLQRERVDVERRPHACQDHGGIVKSVRPADIRKKAVPDHAEQQGAGYGTGGQATVHQNAIDKMFVR